MIIRLKNIKSIEKLLCFYLSISTFNFLTFVALGFFYWHYNNKGIWSDNRLFDGMKLVIISLAIDLTFISLIDLQINSFYS